MFVIVSLPRPCAPSHKDSRPKPVFAHHRDVALPSGQFRALQLHLYALHGHIGRTYRVSAEDDVVPCCVRELSPYE